MQTPTVYGGTQAPTAGVTAAKTATPGIFESIGKAATNISGGEYLDAAGNLKDAFFGTPLRTGATLLGGTFLAGGFTPKQPESPGIVPSETGYDLLQKYPEVYGTSPGGAETVYASPNPMYENMDMYGMRPPQIEFRAPQYPTFAANGGEISRFAEGGIASLPEGAQAISIYYDPKENRYLMQNPEFLRTQVPPDGTRTGFLKLFGGLAARLKQQSGSGIPQYVPFDPSLFSGGQTVAQQAKPFFTPGGAVTVPIQENLAGRAGSAVPMFANGGEASMSLADYERKIAQLEQQKAQKMAQFADKGPGPEHFERIWDRKLEHWRQKQANALRSGSPVSQLQNDAPTQAPISAPTQAPVASPTQAPVAYQTQTQSAPAPQPVYQEPTAATQPGTSTQLGTSYPLPVYSDDYPVSTPLIPHTAPLSSYYGSFTPPPGMSMDDPLLMYKPLNQYNNGGHASKNPANFPRRTGQIAGPGTEKSDSIPAMLSDGEFVMTARAVRGAGNGSRREGAKRMYQMMHKLERKA
jgi:hypothetical protein